MELLLIQMNDCHVCVDVKDVSKVVTLANETLDHHCFLAEPGCSPLGIVFKNGRVLPVGRVVKTVTFQGKTHPLNRFLKGCLTRIIFAGFVIAEKGIYGMLSHGFLQMNNQNTYKE